MGTGVIGSDVMDLGFANISLIAPFIPLLRDIMKCLNHTRTYYLRRMIYCFVLYRIFNELYPNQMDAIIVLFTTLVLLLARATISCRIRGTTTWR